MLLWMGLGIIVLFLLFAISISGKENRDLREELSDTLSDLDETQAAYSDMAKQRDMWLNDSAALRRQLKANNIKPVKPEPLAEPA